MADAPVPGIKKIWPIAIVAVIAIALFVWYFAARASGPATTGLGATSVSATRLKEMLDQKDFELVNVHVPYEGELPQTDAFIPYDRIAQKLEELPGKDEKIVLYCRTGRMSSVAVDVLLEAGYTDVFELSGGFEAWENAGYDLIVR